jgi:hypothetical protein
MSDSKTYGVRDKNHLTSDRVKEMCNNIVAGLDFLVDRYQRHVLKAVVFYFSFTITYVESYSVYLMLFSLSF